MVYRPLFVEIPERNALWPAETALERFHRGLELSQEFRSARRALVSRWTLAEILLNLRDGGIDVPFPAWQPFIFGGFVLSLMGVDIHIDPWKLGDYLRIESVQSN